VGFRNIDKLGLIELGFHELLDTTPIGQFHFKNCADRTEGVEFLFLFLHFLSPFFFPIFHLGFRLFDGLP